LISSCQIRAARALLRWSAIDLSKASGVGTATLQRMEVMEGVPSGQVRTLKAIKEALEGAGVEFLGTPTDGPGVRLVGNDLK
jgi:DNA-binding Xre family transcriptional regulator